MNYIPEIMKYSTRKIKYITPVSINEMRTSNLVNSILERTNEYDKYKFIFDVNGNLAERTYDHSFSVVDYDVVTEGSYNRFVKIHMVDGSCKFGIAGFRLEERTIGRKLMSLYIRKLRNPNTGEWDWPGTLYKYEALDEQLCEKLKFYGEDMEKVVETKGNRMPKLNFGTFGEYYMLYGFVNSNSRFNKWIELLPMGKMPEDINGYNRICTSKSTYISRPPIGYEKWNGLPPQFITYTRTKYLKSIYKDIKTHVLKKEVFFLDDLLMICKEDSFNSSEDGTENMVWNSLEETCRGNIT